MAETKWTDAQLDAITAPRDNILVSAAAGSGKTAVLTERVVRMVTREDNPMDIDRLVVVTFTRAAASHMKNKIYSKLKEFADENPGNVFVRQQLMKVQGARICTIDSLCGDIVRNNFQDTDLDPGFRLADEAEIRLLKKDVLAYVLEEEYKNRSDSFIKLVEYYTDKNDTELENIILTLHRFSESHPEPLPWIRACAYPYMEAGQCFEDTDSLKRPEGMSSWMQSYKEIVDSEIEDIRSMALSGRKIARQNYGPAYMEKAFQDIIRLTIEMTKDDCCLTNRVGLLSDFLDRWPLRLAAGKEDGIIDENLKKLGQSIRGEIKEKLISLRDSYLYADYETICEEMSACTDIAGAIADVTIKFDQALKRAKKERSIADFSDIAHYALHILIRYNEDGEIVKDEDGHIVYTDTADLMAGSIDEIIVDEYQDTNSLQEYLVGALSSGRFGRPDVFMVGDVKQSIYRFRMANPELFSRKLDNYRQYSRDSYAEADRDAENVVSLSDDGWYINLDRNFRSRSEVLDITNFVFRQTMIRKIGNIDYQAGHELVYSGIYDEDDTSDLDFTPEIVMIQGSGDQVKYQEGYWIASKIEELVDSGRYKFSDIAVLTRATDNVQLEKVLKDRGIPVLKTSGKGFFECFEIRLILDLLNVIDNPYQDIPLASVLYSPLCNASANDLAEIRLAGGREDMLYDCLRKYAENDPADPFTGFIERLEDWRKKASYLGIDDLIVYVLEDSGLRNIIKAMPQGSSRQANIELLRSKARSFAKGSYTGIYNFLRYVKELQDNDIDFGTVNAVSAGVDAVQMMTIHKSKGLEFKVVFIACSNKTYNRIDLNGSILPDRELGLGLEARNPQTRLIRKTILMQTIKQKQLVESYAEEMRLLYVAMTRAEELLFISGTERSLEGKIKDWDTERYFVEYSMKPYKIMKCSSYMQLLGRTLHKHKDSSKMFRLDYILEPDIEEMRATEAVGNIYTAEMLNELSRQETDISKLQEQCGFVYPYEKAAHIQGKISASQLENKEIKTASDTDAEVDDRADREETEKYSHKNRPAGKLTGADRGNAYHRFFELLDYEKDVQEQLNDLVRMGRISSEYADAVEVPRIETFLASSLGQRMKEAFRNGQLFREKQFVKGSVEDISKIRTLTGMNFNSTEPDEEMLLVQGIIDAFFIETDTEGTQHIILVDYKTDRSADEQHYIDIYTSQLEAYADALERAYGLKVTERYVYSVEMGRQILLL